MLFSKKIASVSHVYKKEFVDFKNVVSMKVEELGKVVKQELKNVKKRLDELSEDDTSADRLKKKVIEESKSLRRVALEFRSSLTEEIKNIERTRVFRYITQHKAAQLRRRSLSPTRMYQKYVTEHEEEDKKTTNRLRKSLEERRIEELEKRPRARSATTRIIRSGWGASIEVSADKTPLPSFKFGIYKPENHIKNSLPRENVENHDVISKTRSEPETNPLLTKPKPIGLVHQTKLPKAETTSGKNNQIASNIKRRRMPPPSLVKPVLSPSTQKNVGKVLVTTIVLEDISEWWKKILEKKRIAENNGLANGLTAVSV
jgi:hypothetical protein